ncbi:MAG: lysophospholipase [Candidatus Eremiobacteraeota bacterium]|nr:lysophospholipase [Candidatus Eremiobacteraeota bacterium]
MAREPRRVRGWPLKVDLVRVDGARQRVAVLVYEPRRSRDVALVVGHGYSSSKHNLDYLCGFLSSHGFAVYSLDFPGHKLGASGGRLETPQDLVDVMEAVVQFAQRRGVGDVLTLGHSMGAMTALRAAAQNGAIAGVISIATGYGRPTALAALQGRGVTDLRSSYVDGLTLAEVVGGLDATLAAELPELAGRPVLYIAAERDAMVSISSVRELFNRGPEPKNFEIIAGDHTSAGENARSTVLHWLNGLYPRP